MVKFGSKFDLIQAGLFYMPKFYITHAINRGFQRLFLRPFGFIRRRVMPAITLVELLLYLGVFSVASIGIFSLIKYIKTETVTVASSLEQTGQIDLARKYLQTQLGQSDRVSIVDAPGTTGACLHLESTNVTHRRGFRFGERTKSMASAGTINIPPQSSFTVSFWLRTDSRQQGRNDLVNWGRLVENQQFAVLITNGIVSLDFVKTTYSMVDPVDLRDSRWHHIAVVYNGSNRQMPSPQSKWALYIDGNLKVGTYRSSGSVTHHQLNAGNFSTIHVGSLRSRSQNRFQGGLSDIRLWGSELSAADIGMIASNAPESESLQAATLRLRWPLQSLTAGQQQVTDITGNGFTATISGFDPANDMLHVADEIQKSKLFCFNDENNDRRYRLWVSEKMTTPPQSTPDPAFWKAITDDVFKLDPNGFFNVVGNRPDTVTVNLTVTSEQQSSNFNTNAKFKNTELCKVATETVITTTGCQFSRAFAFFQSGYRQGVDELRIHNIEGTRAAPGADVIYRNLPFAPSNVTASWNAATGSMTLQTTDNSLLDAGKWNSILQQVTYIPLSGVSGSKKIILSVGDKAFVQNNRMHFYDFVRQPDGVHSFATAAQQAARQDRSYCGLQPYLMSITSEAEHEFVKDRIFDRFGSWQNGWIGASRNERLEWRWQGGADNQTMFWLGDGAGAPVIASGVDAGQALYSRHLISHDLDLSSPINFSLNRAIPLVADKPINYTYFSAGSQTEGGCNTPAPYNCQPLSTRGYNQLAILGGPKASGLWFAMPDNLYNCEDGELNSICGHYREWGGTPNDPDIKLGAAILIDVATHRQVCAVN